MGLLGAFGAVAVGALGGVGTGMVKDADRAAEHEADLHNAKELRQMEIDASAEKEARVAEAARVSHIQERQEDFAFKNDPANVRMESEAAASKQGALHNSTELAYQRQEALAKHIEPIDRTNYQGRADAHTESLLRQADLKNGGSSDSASKGTGGGKLSKADHRELKDLEEYNKNLMTRLENISDTDPERQRLEGQIVKNNQQYDAIRDRKVDAASSDNFKKNLPGASPVIPEPTATGPSEAEKKKQTAQDAQDAKQRAYLQATQSPGYKKFEEKTKAEIEAFKKAARKAKQGFLHFGDTDRNY